MSKSLFLSLAILFSASGIAQQFSGSATYKTASQLNFKMDNPEMTPDQKKMIEERMAKAMQKEYELKFNSSESLYQEVVELEKEDGRGMRFMSMFGGGTGIYYKDVKNNTYLDQKEFFGKMFLIADTVEKLNWKFEEGSKSIGKYTCNKATAERIITLQKMETVDGEASDTTYKDTIKITAWYSMQIPVSNGPAQYGGLPGLILELNDGQTTMLCTKVSITPGESLEIKKPKDGERVSEQEYTEITTKKMEEMRKMYKGYGRGRGSSSMEIRIGR